MGFAKYPEYNEGHLLPGSIIQYTLISILHFRSRIICPRSLPGGQVERGLAGQFTTRVLIADKLPYSLSLVSETIASLTLDRI